ncbi:MAG: AAA family ATPase [Gammaproteobacteria bacterium]|nr:AAA family ATPase [Gammaproteobacteria bacterium]
MTITTKKAAQRQEPDNPYALIGGSPLMKQVYRLISKVLHSEANILLTGETGTGKELVARAIHEYGHRRTQPFVVQNCASLPDGLLESELFGYKKGAFTGADRNHQGMFDAAHNGILFLDEIGDLPLTLQAKLLRVLQEQEVRPLGNTQYHKINVRVIAATHRNLEEMVAQGEFRSDLYYRLAHFPIELPPLRERDDDIRKLAQAFLDEVAERDHRAELRLSATAEQALQRYEFPGNVRELKSMIERAVLLADDTDIIEIHHFPNLPLTVSPVHGGMLKDMVDRYERQVLIDSLKKHRGNQKNTAMALGVARRTLLYKLNKHNINSQEWRA